MLETNMIVCTVWTQFCSTWCKFLTSSVHSSTWTSFQSPSSSSLSSSSSQSSRSSCGYFQLVFALIYVSKWQGNATRGVSCVTGTLPRIEEEEINPGWQCLRDTPTWLDCDNWTHTRAAAKYSAPTRQLSLGPTETTSVNSASSVVSSRCIGETRCRPKSSSTANCFWKVPFRKFPVRLDHHLRKKQPGNCCVLEFVSTGAQCGSAESREGITGTKPCFSWTNILLHQLGNVINKRVASEVSDECAIFIISSEATYETFNSASGEDNQNISFLLNYSSLWRFWRVVNMLISLWC